MGSAHDGVRDGLRPRAHSPTRSAPVHDVPLRPRADRNLRRAATIRGPRTGLLGVPDGRRGRLRRRDAVPRLDRLPARTARRGDRRMGARAPAAAPVRVLHVHRIGGIGGSERHLLTLLPALAARGIDVRFLGLDDTRRAPDPFYDALAVPYERVSAPRDLDPRLLRAIRRAARNVDLVPTHPAHGDVYGAFGDRTLVSSKHNDDPFRAGAFRFVERALARRTAKIIAITHRSEEH